MYEQYTDKQIVEMLKPKLEKLGWGNVVNNDLYPDTVKMIATIYRSGYIRGQLGRSFIIGPPKRPEYWVPATKDNIKVGSKVRFVNKQFYKKYPQYFPCKSAVGEVIAVCKNETCVIQWPKNTTSDMDRWFARWEDLEVLLCE